MINNYNDCENSIIENLITEIKFPIDDIRMYWLYFINQIIILTNFIDS
jgi:hypothetical protein